MVKLSKINAGINESYINYIKETPPLLIYQNLVINNGIANLNVVSKLTSRIINAFV